MLIYFRYIAVGRISVVDTATHYQMYVRESNTCGDEEMSQTI